MENKTETLEVKVEAENLPDEICSPGELCCPDDFFDTISMCRLCGKLL